MILLDGIDMLSSLFLEAYCVDSYIDGNRVYYNNYYNEAPFIVLFIACGIVVSLICYVVKVLFEYLCLLDRNGHFKHYRFSIQWIHYELHDFEINL